MAIVSKIRQALDRRMIKALTERANKVAEDAKQNANWSKKIPNAISVGKAEKTSSGYAIAIKVDSRPDGPAPHAAAFEYGSGERGPDGEPYLIEPREMGGKLAIPRSRWPDPIYLPYVNHPGVEAKPYLQPAIDSNRDIIRETLGKIFKLAYLDTTIKVTVISAKK
jgi:hypothetical protein